MAKYTYIATVGKTSEKVLIGLRYRPSIKQVCLIGSNDAEVKTCMEQIRNFSEKFGCTVETVEVNAFDVIDVADHVNDIIQKTDHSVIVNVSSGTRVMTIGALIAAYVNNSEVIYVPQQIDEKTPSYIEVPPMGHLLESVALPQKVLTHTEEILPELIKRAKEDHPVLHAGTLEFYIKKLLDSGFEFAAWDTRFERYPQIIYFHDKTPTKILREDMGPYEMVKHFDALCDRCKARFTFPLEIGLGYLPLTAVLSQGESPRPPEAAPPPFDSHDYVNALLQSRKDFYCPRCTLLLGLRNVIDQLNKTQMVV